MYFVGSVLRALALGDAETAHGYAVRIARLIQRHPLLLEMIANYYTRDTNPKAVRVFDIMFPNPYGIASGFDKTGETILAEQAWGAGFAMIGTVLPEEQYGQDKPRYFYLLDDKALINRFGFNSPGARVVLDTLLAIRHLVRIPLGISLGRMKTTLNNLAAADYIAVWRFFWPHTDFATANISSPNTPGLRELQSGRYLENFISSIVQAGVVMAQEFGGSPKPLLVKIAPDLTDAEVDEMVEAIGRGGASGIVVGNTTVTRGGLLSPEAMEMGGVSGKPLYPIMRDTFRRVRKKTELPMIAVGGIDADWKAREMFDEGASLIKVLTGVVYKGPNLIRELRRVG